MILRPRSSRRAESWSQSWEAGYRKRSRDRRQSNRPPGLHHRRQPDAVHPGARSARPVHAGRPGGRVRAAAVAAATLRTRRVRPGDPRLRQRDRRRDEPGAGRRTSPRHGRGDDRLHGADQLRVRHAVDRHRLPLHPRWPVRSRARRRHRRAQPFPAALSPQRGRLVRALVRCPRPAVAIESAGRLAAVLRCAGRRARARPDRSHRRAQHGSDRRAARPSVPHLAARCRPIRGRKPAAARPRPQGGLLRRRARAGVRARRQGL